jgi:hypothetical protein
LEVLGSEQVSFLSQLFVLEKDPRNPQAAFELPRIEDQRRIKI